MKSPLRYPGGKSRGCRILYDIVTQYFDNFDKIDTIISPFFGGGSFEFYLQSNLPNRPRIIANDLFYPLYCFWNIVKNNKKNLTDELYKYLDKVDKDTFIRIRKEIEMNLETRQDSLLQMAINFFIINRCSFSGATLSGGFSLESSKKRFTESSISRITNLNLDKFQITNMDFSLFLESIQAHAIPESNTLVFLDPPYYLEENSKLYGNKGDLHEKFDHKKLYKYIKSINNVNWIMTYNDCEYIRNLYKDHLIIPVDWNYGMNKSKKSSEIVVLSKKNLDQMYFPVSI